MSFLMRDADAVEAACKDFYKLGDHLHTWEDAGGSLKDDYRAAAYALLMVARVEYPM